MKKIVAWGLCMAVLILYNQGSMVGMAEDLDAQAAAIGTSAKAAYVMEISTGRTVFAYNEHAQLPMASTTKVMTALLAIESGKMDAPVTASKNAYGVPGTSIYLGMGETRTLSELTWGLMLASGNDAAVAIAEYLGGTVSGFSELMNERAVELGAKNSHFASPNGLPTDNHYTSAYDLAHIAAQAMKLPAFREIVSTQRAKIPWEGRDYDRVLTNKNRLLTDYAGATGIKTGYTRAAGRCLVFGAQRNGMELVGVVLNCGDWFDEAMRLMDKGFAEYDWVTLLEDGDILRAIPVAEGMCDRVSVAIRGDLAAPLLAYEAPRLVLDLPDVVKSPVVEGTQVGWAHLYVGEEKLASRPVYAQEHVPAVHYMNAVQKMLKRWLLLSPS